MDNQLLFTDSNQKKFTCQDVLERLRSIGAGDCEILFIHTDILFGRPNPELGRRGYLQALYQILLDLHVPTLIFPSFTYSFPNREVYDVRSSRTSMGALIEYIRKQPGVRRSLDPLLSMIAVGKRTDLMTGGGGGEKSIALARTASLPGSTRKKTSNSSFLARILLSILHISTT